MITLARDLRYANVSALYEAVGEGRVSAQSVVDRLARQADPQENLAETNAQRPPGLEQPPHPEHPYPQPSENRRPRYLTPTWNRATPCRRRCRAPCVSRPDPRHKPRDRARRHGPAP